MVLIRFRRFLSGYAATSAFARLVRRPATLDWPRSDQRDRSRAECV